jgi:hypothetical protein
MLRLFASIGVLAILSPLVRKNYVRAHAATFSNQYS